MENISLQMIIIYKNKKTTYESREKLQSTQTVSQVFEADPGVKCFLWWSLQLILMHLQPEMKSSTLQNQTVFAFHTED